MDVSITPLNEQKHTGSTAHDVPSSDSDLPNTHKCAVVIDQDMPLGFIANTAAVLSLSIGQHHPEMIGQAIPDDQDHLHQGITILPVPVLKGTQASLSGLREKLKDYESELTVIDLISATRTTRSYQQYAEVMRTTPNGALEYNGLALYGPKKLVNKFTGNLGLLR